MRWCSALAACGAQQQQSAAGDTTKEERWICSKTLSNLCRPRPPSPDPKLRLTLEPMSGSLMLTQHPDFWSFPCPGSLSCAQKTCALPACNGGRLCTLPKSCFSRRHRLQPCRGHCNDHALQSHPARSEVTLSSRFFPLSPDEWPVDVTKYRESSRSTTQMASM